MIAIAILGLLIPGYTLARALRAPAPWAIAFPLSALILTEIIIAYTLLGIPIRFVYVLNALVILINISIAAELFFKSKADATPDTTEPPDVSKPFVFLAAVLVGLALVGILVRTTLYPLFGPDTVYRWDALPRSMLNYEGLAYYPPLTAEDFAKYTWPECIPPLVATVYWWLYAAWGSACPRFTSIAIVLQASSCFALVYYAARTLFRTAGGVMAIIVLASSFFFLNGVAIGQENGYTAISIAGQLLFTFAAIRRPTANLVVIAGLFGGLGALAREYGPLLSLCGFTVLVCQRETRRFIPLFCLISAAMGAPWYVRTWALTGNPWYSLDTGVGLPVNPVFAGMLATYHAKLGWSNCPAHVWIQVLFVLLLGGPLALLLGLPGVMVARGNRIALGVAALIGFVLWFLSIPSTSGGIFFTWRVLTPAWVALSIAAGYFGGCLQPSFAKRTIVLRALLASAMVICGGYALICCWSQPLAVSSTAVVSTRTEPLDSFGAQVSLVERLEESTLPPVGVLTDDAPLAMALQRYSRFRPVMFYSPEVAFVFDPHLDAAEVRRRLIEKGIWLVSATYVSLNNNYLTEYPFYKELFNNSEPFLTIPETQSLVLLPTPAEQRNSKLDNKQ